jgi:hypothetical protein
MRNSGKISLLSLFAIVALVMVAVVLIFSKKGPGNAGGQFMDALARGNVNELTQLSYLGNTPKSEIKKQWDFSTGVAGRHYNFSWSITAATSVGDSGSVQMSVYRNVTSPGSYAENFSLPMILVNGEWKVDVANISRELYPDLPQGS